MISGRQDELDRLLDAALDRPPAEREAFVRSATGDPELVAAALEVLGDEEADPLIVTGGALPVGAVDGPLAAGTVLGAFRITGELARGGMGVVYRAERCDGAFEQEVALKVLKRGLDTDDVLRRFHRERQILARLQHPAIARVLDGGATPDGRPYFVMERIAGLPLDEYCEARRVGLDGRLRLVVEVASAVAHAHRNLIVHCDLKPSNILVTDDGRPHLLDFGIAGLVAADGEAQATRSTARFLTPGWASPEQRAGQPATTLSDVYQLGLLLYGLVAGEAPAPASGEQGASAPAAPRLPSTAIARREGAASALARRVRGDLDRIVVHALAAEPEARYPSADAFAEDLRRFLDGRPVAARRATLPYRLGKLIRRHRLAAALVALVVLSVAAGVAGTLHQAAAASHAATAAAREAQVARQVRDFLLALFSAADPMLAGDVEPTASELLDRGAGPLVAGSPEDPTVRAELLAAIGGAYVELARYAAAEPLLVEAVALLERTGGPDDPRLAEPLTRLGHAALYLGRPAEALPLYERALAVREHSLPFGDPAIGVALTDVCTAQIDLHRLDDAASTCRRAVAILETAGAAHQRALANALDPLAQWHLLRGEGVEAVRVRRRALEIAEAALGPDHPFTGLVRNNYGMLLLRSDVRAAEQELQLALAALTAALGDGHPRVAVVWSNLGNARSRLERHAEAAEAFEQALAIRRLRLGEDSIKTAFAQSNLAHAYLALGRLAEAEDMARAALATEEDLLGPDHPSLGPALDALGQIRRDLGDLDEAAVLFRRALAIQEATADGRQSVPDLLEDLAELAERRGRLDEAALYRARLDGLETGLGGVAAASP